MCAAGMTDNRRVDRFHSGVPMTRSVSSAATLAALLACVAAAPAHADSSVASSASESISTSFAKLSDSLSDSSASSSPGQHQAKGDYKVIDVAEVDGRPNMLRLRLQPLEPAQQGGEVQLVLPRQAADAGHVTKDAVVTALQRPYGIAFATHPAHEAFFLALDDEWMRELRTNPVSARS
jgi:hypothetical protein